MRWKKKPEDPGSGPASTTDGACRAQLISEGLGHVPTRGPHWTPNPVLSLPLSLVSECWAAMMVPGASASQQLDPRGIHGVRSP